MAPLTSTAPAPILSKLATNTTTQSEFDVNAYEGTNIHPQILELALQLQDGTLQHSSQMTIAALYALRQVIIDFVAKVKLTGDINDVEKEC